MIATKSHAADKDLDPTIALGELYMSYSLNSLKGVIWGII